MRLSWLLMVMLPLSVATAPAFAEPPAESGEQQKDSPPEAAAWVDQLDADGFVERELATQKLIAAGADAIEPIAAELADGSRESVARGLHVLQELALGDDQAAQEAAHAALEKVAASDSALAARQAGRKLAELAELRRVQALAHLRELGAGVTVTTRQIGLQMVQDVGRVEIGENWRGEAEDLRRLRWLDGIQEVVFVGEEITDGHLPPLANMDQLRYLRLKRTSVTADGLAVLENTPQVRFVEVMYSPVDDGAVEHLAHLQAATDLRLFGTDMTKEAAAELQTKLPAAKVDHRHGAFLGVACSMAGQDCIVSYVQPDSAAAEAGVEQGDEIIQYDGEAVESFEQLTKLIGRHTAGDEASLRVRRGGEEIDMEVTLGEWE